MPITVQQSESEWEISIAGQATLASAGELKAVLLEWLAAGKHLRLDLGAVEDIDIPHMQLLLAAAREAAGRGVQIACRASSAAAAAARDAGFAQIPGFPFPGVRDG
ncbi:MAG TPA: STAS domain-containing protein [Bryobacteraceae bacterium]|nr:STAS domain-containing protein [Bryobacteraceae bacterium]